MTGLRGSALPSGGQHFPDAWHCRFGTPSTGRHDILEVHGYELAEAAQVGGNHDLRIAKLVPRLSVYRDLESVHEYLHAVSETGEGQVKAKADGHDHSVAEFTGRLDRDVLDERAVNE